MDALELKTDHKKVKELFKKGRGKQKRETAETTF